MLVQFDYSVHHRIYAWKLVRSNQNYVPLLSCRVSFNWLIYRIGGNLFSAFCDFSSVSVGASTAIFGLYGGIVIISTFKIFIDCSDNCELGCNGKTQRTKMLSHNICDCDHCFLSLVFIRLKQYTNFRFS